MSKIFELKVQPATFSFEYLSSEARGGEKSLTFYQLLWMWPLAIGWNAEMLASKVETARSWLSFLNIV
jgi:hypothetical protein